MSYEARCPTCGAVEGFWTQEWVDRYTKIQGHGPVWGAGAPHECEEG